MSSNPASDFSKQTHYGHLSRDIRLKRQHCECDRHTHTLLFHLHTYSFHFRCVNNTGAIKNPNLISLITNSHLIIHTLTLYLLYRTSASVKLTMGLLAVQVPRAFILRINQLLSTPSWFFFCSLTHMLEMNGVIKKKNNRVLLHQILLCLAIKLEWDGHR